MQLLIEQVVCQLNQADHHVTRDGWIKMFDAFPERLIISVGRTIQLPETTSVRMILWLFRDATETKEVTVVLKQLLETGLRHISELDFGFFRGTRGATCLQDILFARARRLDHLVHGAVALFQEALAKANGAVVNDARFLKGEEILVSSVPGNEMLGHSTFQVNEGTKGTEMTRRYQLTRSNCTGKAVPFVFSVVEIVRSAAG